MTKAAVAALLVVCVHAQAPHKFEVASVKPSRAEDRAPEGFAPDGSVNWNSSLRSLILIAYQLQDYQLAEDPKWLSSEYYRIVAKPPSGPLPANQRERMDRTSEMLRYLLEERFQLKVHHESRSLQEYEIVPAKGGPKLTEVKRGDTPFAMRTPPGKIITRGGAGIEFLARILSIRLQCPVIDKTGLDRTLLYDIQLNYSPDDSPNDPAPSLFAALQEQLGLKLQSIKGPVDVLVIDHVERASEN